MGESEQQETREVDEWARSSYQANWQRYLDAGAPYGHEHDGWARWILEEVQANREAYEQAQKQARRPARTGVAGIFAVALDLLRARRAAMR